MLAPWLTQSVNGIINEKEVFHTHLIIDVDRYETVHIDDKIVVHMNPYLSSRVYPITINDLDLPAYQIRIPFSVIPLGSYDVYYTVTSFAGNPTDSGSTHVTIIKSDYSRSDATLIATGYQYIGDEYQIVTIQMNDRQTSDLIKNTNFHCEINPDSNVKIVSEIGSNPDTVQSVTTNEYGQLNINLKGRNGDECSIKVTADKYVGSVDYTIGKL